MVERLANRLKQFRRLATRYEKRTISYPAMLTLATTVLWLWSLFPVGVLT